MSLSNTTISKSMNGIITITDGVSTLENGSFIFADGTVLASMSDVAVKSSNNTFTGNNTFNNVIVATTSPSADSHLTNKLYVDTGLTAGNNFTTNAITTLKAADNIFSGLTNTFSGNLIISSVLDSANTSTGAVVINGGLGVKKILRANEIVVNSYLTAYDYCYFDKELQVNKALYVNVLNGPIDSSASFQVGGGADISGNVIIQSGTLTVLNGLINTRDLIADGIVKITNNSGAPYAGLGALQLTQGGLFANEISCFNKQLIINGELRSTWITNTGNLTSGTATITGDLTSGTATITGDLTVNGNITNIKTTQVINQAINGNNVGLGRGCLRITSSTGDYNVGVGIQSLYNNTTGSNNTSVGTSVLHTNITGSYNTGLGSSALTTNTGSNNTGIGTNSLYYNSTGSNNTSIGYNTGFNNSTGNNNTYIGYNSNPDNNNYSNSTSLGYNATITENNQIVLGTSAEYIKIPSTKATSSTSTGGLVVAGGVGIGGKLNIDGKITIANNTNTKKLVLYDANSGESDATGLQFYGFGMEGGYMRLQTPSVGNGLKMYCYDIPHLSIGGSVNNVSIGNTALNKILTAGGTGINNSCFGSFALSNTTSGYGNSAFGYDGLNYNSNGSYNSSIGYEAGNTLNQTSGSYNTYLGAYSTNSGNFSNSTAVGYNSQITKDNQIILGQSSTNTDILGSINIKSGVNLSSKGLGTIGTATGVYNNFYTFPENGVYLMMMSLAGGAGSSSSTIATSDNLTRVYMVIVCDGYAAQVGACLAGLTTGYFSLSNGTTTKSISATINTGAYTYTYFTQKLF